MTARRTRALLALACIQVAALVAQPVAAEPPGRVKGFMHVARDESGVRIVGADGKPFFFKGVNVQGHLNAPAYMWGGPLSPETPMYRNLEGLVGPARTDEFRQSVFRTWVTEADIERMADLGFNSVRVPITATDLLVYKGGWEALDAIVDWGEKHRIYVIPAPTALPTCAPNRLPFADYAPGQPLLWDATCPVEHTIDLWLQIARRYRDRRWVGGYDLVNEPHADLYNRDRVVEVSRMLIEAIRSVDQNHMVIVEGDWYSTDFGMFAWGTQNQAARFVTPVEFLPRLDDNMAYMFHTYNNAGDDVNVDTQIATFRMISEAQGVPFFNGEFGVNTYEWVEQTRRMIEDPASKMHGWMYWTWKNVYVDSSFTFGGTPQSDIRFVREISISPRWKETIDYVGGLHTVGVAWRPPPTREEAIGGMADFLEAMKLDNAPENRTLLDALGL